MDPSSYRAADADRQRVAERLRVALEEGRLNLNEYDERLRDTFAARTYADLDALLADIPGAAPQSPVVPAAQAQVAPGTGAPPGSAWLTGPDGRYPRATRRWIAAQWDGWVRAVSVCVAIWAIVSVSNGTWEYFWPGWVAGPWGALVLLHTIRGLLADEPQQWAAKQARKEAEREVRRRAKEQEKAREPDPDAG